MEHGNALDLTASWFGIAAVVAFAAAYLLVIFEEFTHMRKSKPVMLAAGIVWLLIGIAYAQAGRSEEIKPAVMHILAEYGELFLFLLAAMTYVNTLTERNVFTRLQAAMISRGWSYRKLFWATGIVSFFLSAVADNLTTALVMGALVVTIGEGNKRFVATGLVNVVVAANAGGAFSPFGDITTLMVWQKGLVEFFTFFHIFVPSLVNWLVPAAIMAFAVPRGTPVMDGEEIRVKRGGYVTAMLFLGTIAFTVSGQLFFKIPPALGMMTGLGVLKLYGYSLRRREKRDPTANEPPSLSVHASLEDRLERFYKPRNKPFDVFISMKRVEWDTLMFFYGVILAVGGLGVMGYLSGLSHYAYGELGATAANVLVGIFSAVVDNIPIMFAVLTMEPDMPLGQWLLVTLTAGTGGSLLSIGSAAGVALMGQARGTYTFFTHLKWMPVIALGYGASIWTHFLINM